MALREYCLADRKIFSLNKQTNIIKGNSHVNASGSIGREMFKRIDGLLLTEKEKSLKGI